MDRNSDENLNDRLPDQSLREGGLDRSGAPDSNATSESLVGDSMRAGAPRGDRVVDVDRDVDVRRDDVNPGDEIGEAVGGISGVLTGAALGSLGGPIGTIIGGIAGAVSGWWAGRAISEAASHATHDDDYYRTHYESSGTTARSYDDVRPAYQLGHLAGRNPDYGSRSFDEIEGDLRHGWNQDVSARHGQWTEVRDYARHAYERGRSGNVLERGAQRAADAVDDVKDRMDGNPASRPGPDATDSARRAGSAMGGSTTGMGGTSGSSSLGSSSLGSASMGSSATGGMAAGTGASGYAAGNAVERGLDRAGNAMDDLKDRVDGNPASRPGLDATDSARRAEPLGGSSMGGSSSSMGSSALGGTSGSSTGGSLGSSSLSGGTSGLGASGGLAGAAGYGAGSMADRGADALDRTGTRATNAMDDLKDRIDGNPASRPGLDATDASRRADTMHGDTLGRAGDRVENTADRAGNALENAWDKTKNAAHRAGEKIENAVDDTKDRVDGNPASRPGPDRTDDRDRLV